MRNNLEVTNIFPKFVERNNPQGMMKEKEVYRRSFGGKLFVNPDKENNKRSDANKRESNFEKAHLKAYLKGYPLFHFGKDNNGYPMPYEVKSILTKV